MTVTDIIVEAMEKHVIKKEATERQKELVDLGWRYSAVIHVLKEEGKSKGEMLALSDMYDKLDKVLDEFNKTLEDN